MTVAGKEAVRKAFHTKTEMIQPTIVQEYVSARVDAIYDVTAVDDLEASCATRDMVRRAYVQGLKDARLYANGDSRGECGKREHEHIEVLVRHLFKQVRQQYVSEADMDTMRESVQTGYRLGCQEGSVTLGSVV